MRWTNAKAQNEKGSDTDMVCCPSHGQRPEVPLTSPYLASEITEYAP